MSTTIRAFAIFLAVAMFAGGNARAENHVELTEYSDHCMSAVIDDAFDGKIVTGACADAPIGLFARCKGNTTKIYIATNTFLLSDGLRLRTALDGVETPEWDWSMSTDYGALFIRPAIPTIKEVSKHTRLRVRIIEGNGDIHNADIDISRFGEAIKPVREACEW